LFCCSRESEDMAKNSIGSDVEMGKTIKSAVVKDEEVRD